MLAIALQDDGHHYVEHAKEISRRAAVLLRGRGAPDADSDSFGQLIELSERGVGRQKSESVLALQSQHAWYALDCGSFGLQAVC
jgi:hypothetical protein